jgi:1-aminocyclopropane-1-carboxylate deaminase
VQGGYELLDASRGGFAKVDPLLLEFIETTEQACGIPLEPIYTGKALLALKQQVETGRFAPGTRLVFVHTGGLQGSRGAPSGTVPMREGLIMCDQSDPREIDPAS